MNKLIFILLSLFLVSVANATCDEEFTDSKSEVTNMAVETEVPSYLRGATITITQANGKTETIKSEEYMVVKRKHLRPVLNILTAKTKTLCKEVHPKDQQYSKNIVSLKVVDGYSDVDKERLPGAVKLSVDRQVGAGIMYQRALNNRFYIGAELDTNQGAGIMGGVGF